MTEILTEQARQELIAAALEAAKEETKPRAEQVKWQDGYLTLTVVRLPLDATVLNPGSHRIAAEIEALGEQAELITRDPYAASAQQMIADFLRNTHGFDAIRVALKREGQLHPGVITSKGVLINANTRRVALEDNGEQYIDVLVLPSNASEKEITDLELDLQMQIDVKQDYAFTAQLVFIGKLVLERGLSAEDVGMRIDPSLPSNAKGKREAKKAVEQELRLLHLVREVVQASNGAISITKFDDDRQVLIEIDEDYERGRKVDAAKALRVRTAQLASLIAGVRYTKMRKVDDELVLQYLQDAFTDQKTLRPYVDDLLSGSDAVESQGDGLEGLGLLDDLGDEDLAEGPDVTRLFDVLVTAPQDGEISLRNDEGEEVSLPRETVIAGVNQAFMVAIDAKDRDEKDSDRLVAPAQTLRNVARLLDKVADSYDEVINDEEFDLEDFNDATAVAERAWDEFKLRQGDE